MSTNAIIRIAERLFDLGATKILTSRFSQDCLECLFSVARSKQRRPTSLEFRRNLKNITLSQYMTAIPNASYITDDQQHLVGMIDLLSQRRKESSNREQPSMCRDDEDVIEVDYESLLAEAETLLDRAEQNTLYHIAGYVFGKISDQLTSCKTCSMKIASTAGAVQESGSTRFTVLRAKVSDSNFHFITEELFHYFMVMELMFRNYRAHNSSNTTDLQHKLTEELSVFAR